MGVVVRLGVVAISDANRVESPLAGRIAVGM